MIYSGTEYVWTIIYFYFGTFEMSYYPKILAHFEKNKNNENQIIWYI